jgi:peptidoglycan-associated lipoprotein
MKRSAFLNLFIVTIAVSVGSVGCKPGPKGLTPIPGHAVNDRGMGPSDGFSSTSPISSDSLSTSGLAPSAGDRRTLENSDADPSFFAANTIYFEFDSSSVRPSDLGNIEAVASYLRSNPQDAVLIEGHCDDRGTEEYNRSLGERRALSVREVLVTQMGINLDNVLTVSYGEDIPAVDGQNEAAWAKNRRGIFILLRPKN